MVPEFGLFKTVYCNIQVCGVLVDCPGLQVHICILSPGKDVATAIYLLLLYIFNYLSACMIMH